MKKKIRGPEISVVFYISCNTNTFAGRFRITTISARLMARSKIRNSWRTTMTTTTMTESASPTSGTTAWRFRDENIQAKRRLFLRRVRVLNAVIS